MYDNSELRAIRKQLARQTEKEEEELRRQSKQLFHFFGDKRIDDIRIVTNFLRQREHELMIAGMFVRPRYISMNLYVYV